MTPIYASQFTNYVAATPDDVERVVAEIRDQVATEYQHWTDHWKPVKDAFFRDRRGSRDGQELADIVDGAAIRRQPSYARVAGQWARLAPQWDGLDHERLGTRAVQVGNLLVKVPRLCAERHPDGALEVLYVRFNQDRLPLHVVFGVMRIVQLAHPGVIVTFVDVPRLKTYSSRGRDLARYDEWLIEAGNDLAKLLYGADGQEGAA